MKILLIAPIHWHAMWEKQKADEMARYGEIRTPFVIWQGQHFWWKALRELGHEVEVYRYSDPTPYGQILRQARKLEKISGFVGRRLRYLTQKKHLAQVNERIIQTATSFNPHVILISGGAGTIRAQTIQDLKQQTMVPIAQIYGAPPVVFADAELKKAAHYYDCVFTNDYYHSMQWLDLGAQRAVPLPISGCDPEYHRIYNLTSEERKRFSCDVCFVGGLTPTRLYANRVRYLEALAEFDLGIWTDDEELVRSHPKLSRFYRGPAYGADMLKALGAARIALNAHGGAPQHGANMRTFEIPATCTLQMIDTYDPEWFEEGKEVVSYNGVDDLRVKVRYYLEHDKERESIAELGQRRVYNDHTYTHRMALLIELLIGS